MTAISVPSSRPLENRKADALAKVASATRGWSSQPMLVGAFARDVWFWHLNGIETERATEDLDISMDFPDWKGFHAFVSARESQPVAARLGPRHLPWQLAGTPTESWEACTRHAANLHQLRALTAPPASAIAASQQTDVPAAHEEQAGHGGKEVQAELGL